MSSYELIVSVPLRVTVNDATDEHSAFLDAAAGLSAWSKEQSGGKQTGYSVLLLESKEVQS